MHKWDGADWYVEYEEMAAVRRAGTDDDSADEPELSWIVWRMRAQRIHDDILERIAQAQEACDRHRANPDRSWEEIASEIGWQRSIPLLLAACEWLDKMEPEKRQAVPGCRKPSNG